MKLKKILKHIDPLAKVVIFSYEGYKKEEEELFRGFVMDIPWVYANYVLDTDELGEAIGVFQEDNETYLSIFIKEEEELCTV